MIYFLLCRDCNSDIFDKIDMSLGKHGPKHQIKCTSKQCKCFEALNLVPMEALPEKEAQCLLKKVDVVVSVVTKA